MPKSLRDCPPRPRSVARRVAYPIALVASLGVLGAGCDREPRAELESDQEALTSGAAPPPIESGPISAGAAPAPHAQASGDTEPPAAPSATQSAIVEPDSVPSASVAPPPPPPPPPPGGSPPPFHSPPVPNPYR